jgi:hypothetical protein
MKMDPNFERLLKEFPLEAIEMAEDTVYAIRPDLTITYVNRGWQLFAERNGGERVDSISRPIGQDLVTAISLPLRSFFSDNFAKCFREQRPWEHHYECSSADLYRRFMMTAYPLRDNAGLLVVNSLVRELPHDREVHEPLSALYRDDNGIIHQCCHCRRVRRLGSPEAWDWVPQWVSKIPPDTSHGLCSPCYGYYYPCDWATRGTLRKPFQTYD